MLTAAESIDVARATHETVLRVGGLFMTSPPMARAADERRLTGGVLSLRGRVGVLGDVTAATASLMLGTFAPSVVRFAWQHSEALSAHEAATAYADVCADWGRTHLYRIIDAELIAELAETVVDAADLDDLPLASGWRRWPRPEAATSRLAHALMLLRELRYGLYVSAICAHDLTVPVALLASAGGAGGMRRLGWSDGDIDAAQRDARGIPDLELQWTVVKIAADMGFSSALGVLDVHAQRALVDGLARIDAVTRPD